jgi:MinD superfamily P-loop ATPase
MWHPRMRPLDIERHTEKDIDVKRCTECGEIKDAIRFDVLVRRGQPTRLADTCLNCDRAAEEARE